MPYIHGHGIGKLGKERVTFEISAHKFSENYGADIDGNRGVNMYTIEDEEIYNVLNDRDETVSPDLWENVEYDIDSIKWGGTRDGCDCD